MFTLPAGLFRIRWRQTSHQQSPQRATQLTLEVLEDRTVPSVTLRKGVIYIHQTPRSDELIIIPGVGGRKYTVIDNGRKYNFRASQVYGGQVNYHGLGGGDFFVNPIKKLRNWADGGPGDDTLRTGYAGGDTLVGGAGNDNLGAAGVSKTNFLFGGEGDDTLSSGPGSDELYGESGNDQLNGGGGNDMLAGGDGNNTLAGGIGNDSLYGAGGNDYLDGGGDSDHLAGGPGTDTLVGGAGADWMDGGMDGVADELVGDDGPDTFVAEWYPPFGTAFLDNRDKPRDYVRDVDEVIPKIPGLG
jgi:Ca2+-binding RTX toxin-like protein